MKYEKLVRDLVPQRIREAGGWAIARKLSPNEMRIETLRKLVEESKEALEAVDDPTNLKEELADVCEVLDAVLTARGISRRELRYIRRKRARKSGTFKTRTFLVVASDG